VRIDPDPSGSPVVPRGPSDRLTPDARTDRDHSEALEEFDVEAILAFAERVLPSASDLWVQASLNQKQRLQLLFFPEGVAFDGNPFNRTAVTAPVFKYLVADANAEEGLGTLTFASWNQIAAWLRQLDRLGRFVGGTLPANGFDAWAKVECRPSGVTSPRKPQAARRRG
jgi:hypothetical protein